MTCSICTRPVLMHRGHGGGRCWVMVVGPGGGDHTSARDAYNNIIHKRMESIPGAGGPRGIRGWEGSSRSRQALSTNTTLARTADNGVRFCRGCYHAAGEGRLRLRWGHAAVEPRAAYLMLACRVSPGSRVPMSDLDWSADLKPRIISRSRIYVQRPRSIRYFPGPGFV
jgi:hypothetical protein